MPVNAPDPSEHVDVSQETERMRAVLWSTVFKDIDKINKKTKNRIFDLLGENIPQDLQKDKKKLWARITSANLTPHKDDIVEVLAGKNAPMYEMIERQLGDKWSEIDFIGGKKDLKILLTDPTSKEAKIFAYLYKEFGGASNREWQELLIPKELNDVEKKKLKQVDVLRSQYSQLAQDVSFHHLKSKKTALENEKVRLESLVSNTTATPSAIANSAPGAPATAIYMPGQTTAVDNKGYFDRLREIDAEQSTVDSKKQELESRMRKIDQSGFEITNPGVGYDSTHFNLNVQGSIGDFDAHQAVNFGWSGTDVDIGGPPTHHLWDWIADKDLSDQIVALRMKAKRGKAKIGAGVVLDRILVDKANEMEPTASEAEIKAIVKNMRTSMHSATTTTATAPTTLASESSNPNVQTQPIKNKDGLLKRGAKSGWRALKWTGNRLKKEGDAVRKIGNVAYKAVEVPTRPVRWGVRKFWNYMMEEDNSFLGVAIKSQDKPKH